MFVPDPDFLKRLNATSRRGFLKSSLVTGLTWAGAAALARADDKTPPKEADKPQEPNEKKEEQEPKPPQFPDVRLAYIGTAGMGGAHVEETFGHGSHCPCYCAVDNKRYGKAAEHFPQAKAYQDYREMFDKEAKNFDAVMIGTPDHHHFPATVIAMELGKHVYTQKPLTHTPWEARRLAELAAKNPKLVTQMGNQGHANEGWRLIYEWIHSGALGDITEVHCWTDRPIWPQGLERPEGEDAVPANLNWDTWLGPAPVRPYKEKTYHPFAWRGWWDFGAGALGDMACHTMDGMFWALDPGCPTAVEPLASMAVNNETFPKAAVVKWEFPAKGNRKAFTAYWYDGGLLPTIPADLELGRQLGGLGNLFIGTKASLLCQGAYGDSARIFPEKKMKEIGKPKQLLERSPGHYVEWLMAVAGQKTPDFCKSNFGYAGPMSETILLGNVAIRMGRRLDYDGKNMKVTNLPEANQYVHKEYREGWRFGL